MDDPMEQYLYLGALEAVSKCVKRNDEHKKELENWKEGIAVIQAMEWAISTDSRGKDDIQAIIAMAILTGYIKGAGGTAITMKDIVDSTMEMVK